MTTAKLNFNYSKLCDLFNERGVKVFSIQMWRNLADAIERHLDQHTLVSIIIDLDADGLNLVTPIGYEYNDYIVLMGVIEYQINLVVSNSVDKIKADIEASVNKIHELQGVIYSRNIDIEFHQARINKLRAKLKELE